MFNKYTTQLYFKFTLSFILLLLNACSEKAEVNPNTNKYKNHYFNSIEKIPHDVLKRKVFITFLASKMYHDGFENVNDYTISYHADKITQTFDYFSIPYPSKSEFADEFKSKRTIEKIKSSVDSVLNSECSPLLYSYSLEGKFDSYNFQGRTAKIVVNYDLYPDMIIFEDENKTIYSNPLVKYDYAIDFKPDPDIFNFEFTDSSDYFTYNRKPFTIRLNEVRFESILDKLDDRKVYMKLILNACSRTHADLRVMGFPRINMANFDIVFVQLFSDVQLINQIGTIGNGNFIYTLQGDTIVSSENEMNPEISNDRNINNLFINKLLRNIIIIVSVLFVIYVIKNRKRKNK